ncbi:MAG TPA: pyridoxal-phosphate dependent enzyme, partial [Chitinophagales bacterium]|nr:pyridoxal-phosphate dependent enzyme [Chitinophagales bacterium]
MTSKLSTAQGILKAKKVLEKVIEITPLKENEQLSMEFGAKIFLKREDLQVVRSYKIRGAYNFMSQLNTEQKKQGVVCS